MDEESNLPGFDAEAIFKSYQESILGVEIRNAFVEVLKIWFKDV